MRTASCTDLRESGRGYRERVWLLHDEIRQRLPSFLPLADGYRALSDAELSRLEGIADPGPWEAAADAWQRVGMRPARAYALWRQAQAILGATRARAIRGTAPSRGARDCRGTGSRAAPPTDRGTGRPRPDRPWRRISGRRTGSRLRPLRAHAAGARGPPARGGRTNQSADRAKRSSSAKRRRECTSRTSWASLTRQAVQRPSPSPAGPVCLRKSINSSTSGATFRRRSGDSGRRCDRRCDLMSPGFDLVPVPEVAGRKHLLGHRHHPNESLRHRARRVGRVERSEEDAVVACVNCGAELGNPLPAAAAGPALRAECVRDGIGGVLAGRGTGQRAAAEEPDGSPGERLPCCARGNRSVP